MSERIPCPYCARTFGTENDLRQHILYRGRKRADHAAGRNLLRRAPRPAHEDDEPSMAEMAIEATIKRDSGEPLTDLERSLLP